MMDVGLSRPKVCLDVAIDAAVAVVRRLGARIAAGASAQTAAISKPAEKI